MTTVFDASAHLRAELNPIVGRFAEELRDRFEVSGAQTLNMDSWRLIERMLAYAAEAEQRIAEHSRRLQFLEDLSVTDELTGLLNRRGFDQVLERTLAQAERHGEGGLIAYVDLNEFKQLNDRHGHDAGDEALKYVAKLLKDFIRDTDYVARLGGDDFAILLVRAEHIPAMARLLELRSQLNRGSFRYGFEKLPIRASLGATPYEPGDKPANVLRRADAAMYRQKRAHKQSAAA